MTDRAQDALIAEKLFGWKYWTRFGFWWFGPPDEPSRDEFLGVPPMVSVSQSEAVENFTHASEANRSEKWPEPLHYSTDPAASMKLLTCGKLRWKLTRYSDGWYIACVLADSHDSIEGAQFQLTQISDDSLTQAVAACALKSLEAQK